ncbi:MAG: methylenetetrahydrofolate reductase [NAD(P)H] [Bacteroidales bacterium]|jgi:methylenetetrahydrofolate reductase (NADPH)|nr:methylenetetrahydrofolate reductase [NAD(P)H] [Bacteroidales bacterium]
MSVAEILRSRTQTGFSIEILPPIKGNSLQRTIENIDELKDFGPLFINITTHHSEPVYVPTNDGNLRKIFVRKRPGTVAVAAAIQNHYGIPTVPHILCNGFTRNETEYVLIDLNFLGIHDIFVLRGDADKEVMVPVSDCHLHATDLIGQINDINNGRFLDGTLNEPLTTKFSFGVAGYPEKHAEAPNMETDIKYLKAKVDAGAEYVITQLFYDNSRYFDFVKRCREAGITIPIIPGLKPIKKARQLNVLPRVFGCNMPQDLVNAIEKCKDDKAVQQVGIEWLTQQVRELKAAGVPDVHFYTLAAVDSVKAVLKSCF